MEQNRANSHISLLYRYRQRYFARRLTNLEIDMGQMPFLMRCCAEPGITQDAISCQTCMDKGTTARSVKALEAAGFVTRKSEGPDRRKNHVFPTEKAYALSQTLNGIIDDFCGILYRGFAPGEIAAADRFLSKMSDNVKGALGA